MKRFLFLMFVGFVLSSCSLVKQSNKTIATVPVPTPTKAVYGPVVVDMVQIGKSSQGGIATITQEGSKTRVVINLDKSVPGVSEPAHVHFGVCPKPGAVKYALNDVVNGNSDTLLDAPMGELVASGSMAINVHKSIEDISTYVSCGDIKI